MGSEPRIPRSVVTGGSSGIGLEIARRLAVQGHSVTLISSNEERLRTALRQLPVKAPGQSHDLVSADLSTASGVTLAADHCRHGPIHTFVHAAGIAGTTALWSQTPEEIARQCHVNFVSVCQILATVVPAMHRDGGGRIILVSSAGSFFPGDPDAVYTATKSALNSLAESLATHGRGLGIRVSAVCPGFARTEIYGRAGQTDPEVPGWLWEDPAAIARVALEERGNDPVVRTTARRYAALRRGWNLLPGRLRRPLLRTFYAVGS